MSVGAGGWTAAWRPGAKPEPVGRNVSALGAVWLQTPGVGGSSFGRATPSTAFTGCENVSSIGVFGWITAPGVGFTSAASRRLVGNQLTRTGAESVSQ